MDRAATMSRGGIRYPARGFASEDAHRAFRSHARNPSGGPHQPPLFTRRSSCRPRIERPTCPAALRQRPEPQRRRGNRSATGGGQDGRSRGHPSAAPGCVSWADAGRVPRAARRAGLRPGVAPGGAARRAVAAHFARAGGRFTSTAWRRRAVQLMDLATAPEYRGLGFASSLIAAAERQARSGA